MSRLEEALQEINREKIQLKDEEIKRNNQLLHEMMEFFIGEFKKDSFFNSIYERFFFGGSFYDGLKVGKPNEFDIDLVFTLPTTANATIIINGQYPGFVEVQVNRNVGTLNDGTLLLINNIMKWFQGLVDTAKNAMRSRTLNFSVVKTTVTVGPAITFTISDKRYGKQFDVDFVPCFKFPSSQWPRNYVRLREGLVDPNDQLTKEFLVVPKPRDNYCQTLFRLSFQGQERLLLEGKGHVKPAIRLLKLYRDQHTDSPIKSYYLKTLALHALQDSSFIYKDATLSSVFVQLLKRLIVVVRNRQLKYFWNHNYNLLEKTDGNYFQNLANRLEKDLRVFESGNKGEVKRLFG